MQIKLKFSRHIHDHAKINKTEMKILKRVKEIKDCFKKKDKEDC